LESKIVRVKETKGRVYKAWFKHLSAWGTASRNILRKAGTHTR